MIKNLPTKIKLPNYDLSVSFETPPPELIEMEEYDEAAFKRYGEFDLRTYNITVMKTDTAFDPYSYTLFLTAALLFCQDIKLSAPKQSILAFFLYYIFTHNDIHARCKEVTQNKDTKFDMNILGFTVETSVDSDYKDSPGYLSIPDGFIKINRGVSAKVKSVILIHELLEWANALFALGMAHHTIQSFSELLVYVISNNNFVS